MTGVRELLREGVALPSADVDVADVMRTARGRRRRRRGMLAAFGVVVLALASFGLVRASDDGGGPARVAIGPRQTSDIPDGWKTLHADPGISIAVPLDWRASSPSATPIGQTVLSVEDLPPDVDALLASCTTNRVPTVVPSAGGSLITMWEFPAGASHVPGTANDVLDVVDRPATFADSLSAGPQNCPGATYDQIAFRDSGRVFVVRVVTVFPTESDGTAQLDLAYRVLNTLKVAPLETPTTATSTSTPAPSTTVPPTTSAPAFVPTSTDEQQITELFQAWPQAQSDDEILATFEDGASILDAMHQGLAQRTPEDLAKYSGQVDSVQVTDPNHAIVEYTLLFDGQAQFGRRTGGAVKVDGAWRVSRDTECALLALGAITCPPRSSP